MSLSPGRLLPRCYPPRRFSRAMLVTVAVVVVLLCPASLVVADGDRPPRVTASATAAKPTTLPGATDVSPLVFGKADDKITPPPRPEEANYVGRGEANGGDVADDEDAGEVASDEDVRARWVAMLEDMYMEHLVEQALRPRKVHITCGEEPGMCQTELTDI